MMGWKASACLFLLIAGVLGNLPITYASGQLWIEMSTPTTAHLFDVYMINATDGWIVGNGGTILHWNGVEWSQVTSPTTADLRGVCMYNSTEGWAVGLNGTILRWTATEWVSEISTWLLMPLLIRLTVSTVVTAKKFSKKYRGK